MKANLPAALCFVALVYCCWELYRSQHQSILEEDRVVITVHGPNGTIIEPAGPAVATPPPSGTPRPSPAQSPPQSR